MHHARMIVVMAMLALAMMVGAGEAFAQNNPTGPVSGNLGGNGCSEYVGLSNRIVMCLRDTIDLAAGKYFGEDTDGDGAPDSGMFRILSQALTGFFTLAVIIYGILAAYGMLEKPGRDVMLLMVKLSLVMGFVVKSDWIFETTLTAMDSAGAAVVRFTPQSGEMVNGFGADRLTCIENMKKAANERLKRPNGDDRPNYASAWLGMDCIIDTVIGIKVAPEAYGEAGITGKSATKGLQDLTVNKKLDKDNPGMARGIINFFFSSMQSSIMGIILAVVGFVFVYSLLWMVVKALFVYIAGYLGLAFLIIFAPLFIPLVLFRVTSEYFKKWMRLCIGFALQPVIILAFVAFSVVAVDFAMFSGDYSVMYRIAGEESRKDNFNINKYMDDKKLIKKKPTEVLGVKTSDKTPALNKGTLDAAGNEISGILGKISNSDCGERMRDINLQTDAKAIDKTREECGSYAIQWFRNNIDWEKMAEVRSPAVTPAERVQPVTDKNGNVISKGDGPDVTEATLKGRAISREVLSAVLFATLVVLCINGLMSIIPGMVNDLVGESFQSPNLFAEVSRQSKGGGITSKIGSMFGAKGGGK